MPSQTLEGVIGQVFHRYLLVYCILFLFLTMLSRTSDAFWKLMFRCIFLWMLLSMLYFIKYTSWTSLTLLQKQFKPQNATRAAGQGNEVSLDGFINPTSERIPTGNLEDSDSSPNAENRSGLPGAEVTQEPIKDQIRVPITYEDIIDYVEGTVWILHPPGFGMMYRCRALFKWPIVCSCYLWRWEVACSEWMLSYAATWVVRLQFIGYRMPFVHRLCIDHWRIMDLVHPKFFLCFSRNANRCPKKIALVHVILRLGIHLCRVISIFLKLAPLQYYAFVAKQANCLRPRLNNFRERKSFVMDWLINCHIHAAVYESIK